jgi:small subunit ribosomal protein S8
MSQLDTISDFLTHLRNALHAKHRYVDVKKSKMVFSIVQVLEKKKMIQNFLVKEDKPQGTIRIFLKYDNERSSIIQGLKRISSPGRRYYINKDEIPFVFDGLGLAILSTPQGVMDDQEARKAGVGGEYLCCVW